MQKLHEQQSDYINWLKEKVKCWAYGHEYVLVVNSRTKEEFADCFRCADLGEQGWQPQEDFGD